MKIHIISLILFVSTVLFCVFSSFFVSKRCNELILSVEALPGNETEFVHSDVAKTEQLFDDFFSRWRRSNGFFKLVITLDEISGVESAAEETLLRLRSGEYSDYIAAKSKLISLITDISKRQTG